MSKIGKRIKTIRAGTHQTQLEVSKILGVSKGHISAIERGTATPSDQFIKSFCRAYNILESWLRTGSGPLIIAPTRTWEEIVETQPIRKDPVYEGLRLLLEDSAEVLRRTANTLLFYRFGTKITDQVRPEVLTAKQSMLEQLDRLRLIVDSLLKWEEEAIEAQKKARTEDNP